MPKDLFRRGHVIDLHQATSRTQSRMKRKCRFGSAKFLGREITVGKRRAAKIDESCAQRCPAKAAQRRRIQGHTSGFSSVLSFSYLAIWPRVTVLMSRADRFALYQSAVQLT